MIIKIGRSSMVKSILINKKIYKDIITAYRTPPVETSFIYIDQQANIKIPVRYKMELNKIKNILHL